MYYLKLFETTAQYNAYTADTENYVTPNVAVAKDAPTTVYYNPLETRVVTKFNVTSTSSPTRILGIPTNISAIEIDGVEQDNIITGYTFSTTGEHTVKYTLADPTSIGNYAFYQCISLSSIDLPNSVTSIGELAFQGCSGLTSIDLPNSVTSISDYAFTDCSGLTSCTIGSGVISIGMQAFVGCTSLSSIDLSSGVTSIGDNAFYNCSSLTSITCNATTAPTIQSNTFYYVKTDGTLTVPSGSSGYDTWMSYLGDGWTKVEV